MQSAFQTDSPHLAPHACSNCKNGHRKCDRFLPVCSNCKNKKKEHTCSYDEPPQKRGPKRQQEGDGTAKPEKQPRKRRKKDTPSDSPINSTPPPSQSDISWGQRNPDFFAATSSANTPVFQIQSFNRPQQSPLTQVNQIPQHHMSMHQQHLQQTLPPISFERQHVPAPLMNQITPPSYSHFMNEIPYKQSPTPQQPTIPPLMPQPTERIQSTSNNAQLNHAMPSSIQNYFQQLFINTPIMDRRKAIAIVSYINDLQNGTQTTTVTPNNDELALIFAMQAWFYRRFLMSSMSTRCIEKSRELIARDFDGVLSNTNLAMTFCHMGILMLEDNDFDRCLFYLNNVSSYLRKCVDKRKPENPVEAMILSYRHKIMRMIHFQAMYCVRDQKNLSQLAKSQMLIFYYGKQIRKLGNILEAETQTPNSNSLTPSSEELEFGKFLEVMQDDVDNNTDNFRLNAIVMDRLSTKFIEIFAKGDSGMESDLKNLAMVLVAQGVKLQCLQREGKSIDPETRRSADQVSNMTTSVGFNYAHYTTIQPVALAMGSHMRFWEATNDARERSILIDLLKTDLRGLALLGDKFKFVRTRYAGLMNRVETTIKTYEDQQQLQQLYASMRTYSDVLGEAHTACANRSSSTPLQSPVSPSILPTANKTPVSAGTSPSSGDESSRDSMLDLLYGTDDGLQRSSSMPLFDVGDEFLEDFFGSDRDSPGTRSTATSGESFFL